VTICFVDKIFQTVVFDSCHSGSSTRDGSKNDLMSRGVKLPGDYAAATTVDQQLVGDSRKAKVASSFEHSGLISHVLLAACSEKETAQESGGHGHFTSALLEYLRDTTNSQASYVDLIENLRDLGHGYDAFQEGLSRHDLMLHTGSIRNAKERTLPGLCSTERHSNPIDCFTQ
jgi:hypothetical protein